MSYSDMSDILKETESIWKLCQEFNCPVCNGKRPNLKGFGH